MSALILFTHFCEKLVVSQEEKQEIDEELLQVIRGLDVYFHDAPSQKLNAIHAGAYGTGTAPPPVRDLDIFYILPWRIYHRYSQLQSGVKALMSDFTAALECTVDASFIRQNGSAAIVEISVGRRLHLTPAFEIGLNDTLSYPIPTVGGWKTIRPSEQLRIYEECDHASNGNLKDLSRMMRAWRDTCGLDIEEQHMDLVCLNFIQSWNFRGNTRTYYGWMCSDFFRYALRSTNALRPRNHNNIANIVLSIRQLEFAINHAIDLSIAANSHLANGDTPAACRLYRQLFGHRFPAQNTPYEDQLKEQAIPDAYS